MKLFPSTVCWRSSSVSTPMNVTRNKEMYTLRAIWSLSTFRTAMQGKIWPHKRLTCINTAIVLTKVKMSEQNFVQRKPSSSPPVRFVFCFTPPCWYDSPASICVSASSSFSAPCSSEIFTSSLVSKPGFLLLVLLTLAIKGVSSSRRPASFASSLFCALCSPR